MAELDLLTWTFSSECSIPKDIEELMVAKERPIIAYKTIRDVAIITNKRFIIRDAQGFTGKKVEIYSIPFKSINMWSTENTGRLDFNSEIELWTRAGRLKINLAKGVDVRKIDRIMAKYIL